MPASTTIKDLLEEFNTHVSASNPHNDVHTIIWGLDRVENTSDESKPVSMKMQAELDKKMNVSDVYNSLEESSEIDLTTVPWSAAQGYSMSNVIDTYQAQDTTELEKRIKRCEDNV